MKSFAVSLSIALTRVRSLGRSYVFLNDPIAAFPLKGGFAGTLCSDKINGFHVSQNMGQAAGCIEGALIPCKSGYRDELVVHMRTMSEN
jgi:hypothetical protein